MANTKYSDLLPYVVPGMAGLSGPLAELHIRGAVIELCRLSKVWTVDLDPQATEPGQAAYDIEVPVGAAVIDIKAMYFDGFELAAYANTPVNLLQSGRPSLFYQSAEAFSLWPVPDSVAPITMTLAVAPSRTSSSFPSWISEKYHEGIIAGAKARLMLVPGNPWSNPAQAALHRSIFEADVALAIGDATRGFTRAPLRTTSQH